MLNLLRVPVKNEQPRLIPLGSRMLRDSLTWQLEIKVGRAHGGKRIVALLAGYKVAMLLRWRLEVQRSGTCSECYSYDSIVVIDDCALWAGRPNDNVNC